CGRQGGAGGAPCRSAALRAARRKAASAGWRAHAGGASRGLAYRELVAGRRQQGYLGAGRIVLRRIAGSLFWAARYLERAQWRARLVDVNYHRVLEVPPRDLEPWEPLVRITAEQELFATKHSHATESSVIDFFVFDKENPSSIRSCIEAV